MNCDVLKLAASPCCMQGSQPTWKPGKTWKMTSPFSSQGIWEKSFKSENFDCPVVRLSRCVSIPNSESSGWLHGYGGFVYGRCFKQEMCQNDDRGIFNFHQGKMKCWKPWDAPHVQLYMCITSSPTSTAQEDDVKLIWCRPLRQWTLEMFWNLERLHTRENL